MKKKVTTEAQPRTRAPQTRACLHPRLADSMNPYAKPPKPTVAANAPAQSILPDARFLLSGTCHNESTMTAAAIGTFMKNAHRQEACSINQPPKTGPIAVVIAVNPDHVP